MSEQNGKHESNTSYLPLGMSIGISLGLAIGAATGNIPTFMSLGLGVGLCVGSAIDAAKRNKRKENTDMTSEEEEK